MLWFGNNKWLKNCAFFLYSTRFYFVLEHLHKRPWVLALVEAEMSKLSIMGKKLSLPFSPASSFQHQRVCHLMKGFRSRKLRNQTTTMVTSLTTWGTVFSDCWCSGCSSSPPSARPHCGAGRTEPNTRAQRPAFSPISPPSFPPFFCARPATHARKKCEPFH